MSCINSDVPHILLQRKCSNICVAYLLKNMHTPAFRRRYSLNISSMHATKNTTVFFPVMRVTWTCSELCSSVLVWCVDSWQYGGYFVFVHILCTLKLTELYMKHEILWITGFPQTLRPCKYDDKPQLAIPDYRSFPAHQPFVRVYICMYVGSYIWTSINMYMYIYIYMYVYI